MRASWRVHTQMTDLREIKSMDVTASALMPDAGPVAHRNTNGVCPPMTDLLVELARAPHRVLGPQPDGIVRTFQPRSRAVEIIDAATGRVTAMVQIAEGIFEARNAPIRGYLLRIDWGSTVQTIHDPYAFWPLLSDHDLHLFKEGRFIGMPDRMGAHVVTVNGIGGVHFSVWAPNASSVAVVGDFNVWDPRRHPMFPAGDSGIRELFVPGVAAGEIYKFAIRDSAGVALPWKADPLARQAELPPHTGSIVALPPAFGWTDATWMARRGGGANRTAPISIYEVHAESWLRTFDDTARNWDAAGDRLIPYVVHMGFTHIELMPVAEHPFGGSWGYQPLSLFAPTARLGGPAAFARFVDRCHAAGIGVIVDWVPAHFPNDEHGLVRFDGTALYEHLDPREGFHPDWNTMIYNVGRNEVRGFLVASALWWLERFHVDGLRVDAVASMLYRDYSRKQGEWVPNHLGGRENLEAVFFLQELNRTVRERAPSAMMIAEESTSWPGVTSAQGLGFHYKWNMGWMHDTLRYFSRDPVHRKHHTEDIAFGLIYAFSENFILPLSHDEVVHGKGSLLSRMPGDDWQKFANLRALLGLMWTHPGKKLLFMGGEFGAEHEWNADAAFPWPHPDDVRRQGLMQMVRDLNQLYRNHASLHALDSVSEGFRWVVMDDFHQSVIAFLRLSGQKGDDMLVVLNATPVPRHDYRIGVPTAGYWRELFNSDSFAYGGSNVGNAGGREAEPMPSHGELASLHLSLPPLGLIVLQAPITARLSSQ